MQLFKENRSKVLVVMLTLVYVCINMYATFKAFYFFNLLPIAVLLVFLAFTRLDILYFILIFCIPLSIPLIEYFPTSPIDFFIPTEPLLFGIMLIVVYRMAYKGFVDYSIFLHPVSLAIIFYLVWILITSITSSMPIVSFKYLLARIWFIITFYLVAIHVFRDTKNIKRFIWLYTLPMLGVIAYTIEGHLTYGLFDKMAAHTAMGPFFRDHTSYGAVLAMLIFGFVGVNISRGKSFLLKIVVFAITSILIVALILSYTRAAWVSVFIGLGVMVITLFRIKFKYIAFTGFAILAYVIINWLALSQSLEKNNQDSSEKLSEHFKSISNISSDASNLERINRWSAAFRMFKERPIFGWGPGTYSFQYAPFQLSKNRTIISTDFGDSGNAHSEYIGPLSESGIPGTVSFLLIAIISLVTGFRVYNHLAERSLKFIVLFFILGLISYLIHGAMNNFLDTDKASSLFWGFIAAFVSLDIYCLKQKEQEKIPVQE